MNFSSPEEKRSKKIIHQLQTRPRKVGSDSCLCFELFFRITENGILNAWDCLGLLKSTSIIVGIVSAAHPPQKVHKKKSTKKNFHKKLSWTLHLWPANGFMALEAGTPNSTYQTTSSLEVVILREYQSLSFVCSTESNLLYWSLLYSSSTVLQQSQNQEAPSYKSFGQRKLTCVMKRRKNTNKQNF